MARLSFIVAFVLLGAIASAQAPVPPALRSSKTAYVTNEGVKRDMLDRLVKDLAAWKRFTVVAEKKDADIVIALRPGQQSQLMVPIAGLGPVGGSFPTVRLEITRADTGESLWSDGDPNYHASPGYVSKLIKALRKRMDAK